jgi:hypothetical protein
MRRLLERSIDALPLAFRGTFMLREAEEITVASTLADRLHQDRLGVNGTNGRRHAHLKAPPNDCPCDKACTPA